MIKNLSKYIWYNGDFILSENANLHISSYGLHYASAVFEGEKLYNGQIFKLLEHSERLIQSAKLIGLNIKYSVQEIIDATENLIKKNQLVNAYVRPVAWKRSNFLKLLDKEGAVHSSVDVAIIAISSEVSRDITSLNLYVSDWKKIPGTSLPIQSKCAAQYVTSHLAKEEALSKGYDECLLLTSGGFVAESSVSNIFFVKNNLLVTPSSKYCLKGITRDTIIKDIAPILGLKIEESNSIQLSDLDNFDEAFITGTSVEIKNISSISCKEQKYLFAKNSLTKDIRDLYFKMVNKF